MKRKEGIKQTQEGVAQVFNDYHPSTKEIKKFLKEAFPEDKDNKYSNYFQVIDSDSKRWVDYYEPVENLPIINLSTITKRKKTKLSQLEVLISDVAKDVADLNKNVSELRQTLAKNVEVVVEEVESELVVNRWYKNDLSTMHSIFYATEHYDESKHFSGYGFEKNKNSKEFTFIELRKEYWQNKNLSEATPQEVETALVNEAKKRGFENKVKYKSVGVLNSIETLKSFDELKFYEKKNILTDGWGGAIFNNGIWAEIQEETIKEDVIDWNVPQLVMTEGGKVVATNGNHVEDTFNGILLITDNNLQTINEFSTLWAKYLFKPFKGKLTIEQSL